MQEPGSETGRAGVAPGSPAGEPGSVAAEKASLRARLLAAREAQSADQRAAAGRLIRDHVLSLPQAQMAGTVAAYFSVGTEPETRSLIYGMWKRGTYVILPLLRPGGELDWASYEGPESLVPGPKGLLEPSEPPRGADAVARAALVLVPALAVDTRGNRLGRGGGSYDRALALVGPRVPVIALLNDGELLGRVPAEPHDRRVSMVALPSRGIVSIQIPLCSALRLALALCECQLRVLASRDARTSCRRSAWSREAPVSHGGRTCAHVSVRLHGMRRSAREGAEVQR